LIVSPTTQSLFADLLQLLWVLCAANFVKIPLIALHPLQPSLPPLVVLVWYALTPLPALLELLLVASVTRVINVLLLLSSITLPSVSMDIVLLPSELLEMLAPLLLTALLESVPVLDVLEKPTEPIVKTAVNADLDLIVMELAWPQ